MDENPPFKCPDPTCSVDMNRYFSDGPLKGTSKYCGFCKNQMSYVSYDAYDITLFCDDCRRLIDKYLTLHEHTFTIMPMFGLGLVPADHNDIEKYIIHCNSDCGGLVQHPSEQKSCEVIERLNDIDYGATMNNGKAKGLSPVVLLNKLITSLEKTCHLCPKSSASLSSCLVINRHFDPGTLDYSPIFPLCGQCFKTYSLKHEYYPPHHELCSNGRKCFLDGIHCDYDWDKLSGCIEIGRDGHQIFCEGDCEEMKKL